MKKVEDMYVSSIRLDRTYHAQRFIYVYLSAHNKRTCKNGQKDIKQ